MVNFIREILGIHCLSSFYFSRDLMRGCRPFDLLNNCGSITVRQASKPLLKQPQLNKNMVISIESNAVEPVRLFKLIFGKGLTEKIGSSR
jgi:hypothetical protein